MKTEIVELSLEDYRALFEQLKGVRRLDSYCMSNAQEMDRLEGGDKHVKEYLNPQELPVHIDMVGGNGTTRYILKR